MFRKLITLVFVLVTVKALSLRSARNEETTEQDVYRLPTSVVPIHYDWKIESGIGVGDFNFTGETDTKIDVREPTKEIVLNWLNLTLDETQTRLCNDSDESIFSKKHLYDYEKEMLTLVFDDVIVPAIYTLHIGYSGVLSQDRRGLYGSNYTEEDGKEAWLVVAHFQPISARRAFPCWDEPALKATFNISVKHHANYTALSNMPEFQRSEVDGDEAQVWTRFEKTPIMSTHILGLVIGDLANISTPDGSIRVWARKSLISNMQYFFDIAQKVNDHFTEYMNISAAVPKMDHVAVPEFSSRATENWGLIVYKEVAMAYYPNKTTLENFDKITMVAIHEMAHQWISNVVGPHWWTHMWMSEGFAAYFQFYMLPKFIEKPWTVDQFLLEVQKGYISQWDTCPNGNPMSQNVSKPFEIPYIYSYITYRKAPLILRMLAHCMSEKVFRAGLLNYVNAFQYKTAMPDDLWHSMQDALDQSNVPHEEFKIKDMMDTWTEQEGYPLITINRDYDTGVVQIRQNGRNRIPSEVCSHKWWVPLNFAIQANPDFSSTLPTHWLSPLEDTKTITDLPKDGWIIANIQETGYYRVQYDLENWKRLASYLNSDDYEKIHVLNRFQIISDAFHDLKEKKLPCDVFGMVMNYLSRETDPLPLNAAWASINEIEYLFQYPETSTILKRYIRHVVSKNLEYMDYNDRLDDERRMQHRKHVLKDLSCISDVPESLGNATAQLIEYLEDPSSITILPDSQTWVFCCGLKQANQSTWNAVLDLYLKNEDMLHLESLVCSNNENILKNLLNITLLDDSPFPQNEIKRIYNEMILKKDTIGLNLLIDFLGENLNQLTSKVYDLENVISFLSYRITTTEQLDKMTAILTSRGKPSNEMAQHVKSSRNDIKNIETCLQTIAKVADLPSEK